MKKQEKILLYTSYTDESGKCWLDSYVKNIIVQVIDGDIHKTILETLREHDGIEMSYKGKPQGNIFEDDKDGNAKRIGYHYRCKNKYIEKGNNSGCITGYFTAWVTIKSISDYPIIDMES